jgi:RNA polymerase sigma factor (sigma-70 family)
MEMQVIAMEQKGDIGATYRAQRKAAPLRVVSSPLYPAVKKNAGGAVGADLAGADPKVEGSRGRRRMIGEPENSSGQGMDAVLLAHRAQLIRFLEAHGAGDAAEDLFQELWMRVTQRPVGPIGNPVGYLFRAANNLMVDRYRAECQSRARDHAWTEAGGLEDKALEPSAEEQLIAREELRRMNDVLASLGDRAARCFRRFRLDGIPQREIAVELGVSLSTVESDLRRAYAALLAVRRQSDDA